MLNIGMKQIKNQCKRFQSLFDEEKMNQILYKMRKEVISIQNQVKQERDQIEIKKHFQHGTSCDSSAMKSNDLPYQEENDKKKVKLNFKEMESMLIDKNSLDITDQNITNTSLLSGIKDNVNYYGFLNFIKNLPRKPEIKSLYFCFYKNRYSLIVDFYSNKEMKMFLNAFKKGLPNFINFFGNNMKIFYIKKNNIGKGQYFSQEQLFYQIVLKIKKQSDFFMNNFVGVIIRNIPVGNELKEIINIVSNLKIKCNLDQIVNFGDQRFGMIRFAKIEEAEKAIFVLNNKQIVVEDMKMKINIHSQSNFTREEEHKVDNYFACDQLNKTAKEVMEVLVKERGGGRRSKIVKQREKYRRKRSLNSNEQSINFDSSPSIDKKKKKGIVMKFIKSDGITDKRNKDGESKKYYNQLFIISILILIIFL